jgi:hypothetical protein
LLLLFVNDPFSLKWKRLVSSIEYLVLWWV